MDELNVIKEKIFIRAFNLHMEANVNLPGEYRVPFSV